MLWYHSLKTWDPGRTHAGTPLVGLRSSWSHTGYTDAHQSLTDSGTAHQTVREKNGIVRYRKTCLPAHHTMEEKDRVRGYNIILSFPLQIQEKMDFPETTNNIILSFLSSVRKKMRQVCGICSTVLFTLESSAQCSALWWIMNKEEIVWKQWSRMIH